MERKNFELKLQDGKFYTFSERDRRDKDFSTATAAFVKEKLRIIQESVTERDERLALMMYEMKREHSVEEVSKFVASSTSAMMTLCYDSFKIANPNIPFDDFSKLFSPESVLTTIELIHQVEGEGEKRIASDEKKKAHGFLRRLLMLCSFRRTHT